LPLSRPLVFFTPRFILIETVSDISSYGWIGSLRNRGAILLFDFFTFRIMNRPGIAGGYFV